MLRTLPFSTFGKIAALGLEVDVYCARCRAYRRLVPSDERVRDRCFAGAPFRCRLCDGLGVPRIQPPELLKVGGPVTLAFLFCKRCAWEINQAQLDKPPWSNASPMPAEHYRCPGCAGRVDWHSTGRQGDRAIASMPRHRASHERCRMVSEAVDANCRHHC